MGMRWPVVVSVLVLGANLGCQTEAPAAAPAGPGIGGSDSGGGGGGGNVGVAGGTGGASGGGAAGHPIGGDSAIEPATFQYDGSLAFASAVVVGPRRVEISAPILPRTSVIYQAFPTSLEGEQAMAHAAALLFDWLLPQCAPLYPKITLAPDDGTPLAPAQLAVNYEQIGRCSYEQYVAKPYWIPKLVDDVDICGTEMGAGWRLISEADLASLAPADFQTVADTWQVSTSGSTVFSSFYASLAIWVRGDDGTIQSGTLAPDWTGSRVTPLPPEHVATEHYEGSLGLRCIRRSDRP
jgi:hypothetical protein